MTFQLSSWLPSLMRISTKPTRLGLDLKGGVSLIYQAKPTKQSKVTGDAINRLKEMGCRFAIDSDAHAPGQLSWQPYGCVRATECGVDPSTVVNTMTADDLVAWARLSS